MPRCRCSRNCLEKDVLFPATFGDASKRPLGMLLQERSNEMREGQPKQLPQLLLKHKTWIYAIKAGMALCFRAALFLPTPAPKQPAEVPPTVTIQQHFNSPSTETRPKTP